MEGFRIAALSRIRSIPSQKTGTLPDEREGGQSDVGTRMLVPRRIGSEDDRDDEDDQEGRADKQSVAGTRAISSVTGRLVRNEQPRSP